MVLILYLSIRFKLQLQVIDKSGVATFTVFNTIVAKLLGRTAPSMIRDYPNVWFIQTKKFPIYFLDVGLIFF